MSRRRLSRRLRAAALLAGLGAVVAVGAAAAFLRLGCSSSARRPAKVRGPLLGMPAPGIAVAEPAARPSTALSSQTAAAPTRRRTPLQDYAEFWVNGQEVDFHQTRGRPILLYFWHPRDGQSLATLPRIVALADRFARRGLLTVGFCVVDSPAEVGPILSEYHVRFPVAIDCDGDLHRRYRIPATGTPYCYLVDPRQTIVWEGKPEDLSELEIRGALR